MGPKSRDLVAEGFRSIAREQRRARVLNERNNALLEALAVKLHITEHEIERHEAKLYEHGRAISEHELRIFNSEPNGAE